MATSQGLTSGLCFPALSVIYNLFFSYMMEKIAWCLKLNYDAVYLPESRIAVTAAFCSNRRAYYYCIRGKQPSQRFNQNF